MCTGEVLRRGEVAVLAVLTKPFIRGEHVWHHAEGGVRLHGHQAGGEDARSVPGEEVSTLFAHLLQVLGSLDQGLAGEQRGPSLQFPVPHPAQPPHDEAPWMDANGHDTQNPVHQLLEALSTC